MEPTVTPSPTLAPAPTPLPKNSTTPTPVPALESNTPVLNYEVPAWEYQPGYAWYHPTPSPAPANASANVTVATPAPTGPTPVPTPLARDIGRERTGTSLPSTVAVLLGLVSAGFLAGIGYLLIRK
jgi:hypothetical protein